MKNCAHKKYHKGAQPQTQDVYVSTRTIQIDFSAKHNLRVDVMTLQHFVQLLQARAHPAHFYLGLDGVGAVGEEIIYDERISK